MRIGVVGLASKNSCSSASADSRTVRASKRRRRARLESPATLPPGGRAQMARFPEKTDLILLTDRPPQLETPIRYFRQDLTPNDAFFVRWHLSAIPTAVDLSTFRLDVAGHVERPVSLSVAQLKKEFKPVSLVAVAQC